MQVVTFPEYTLVSNRCTFLVLSLCYWSNVLFVNYNSCIESINDVEKNYLILLFFNLYFNIVEADVVKLLLRNVGENDKVGRYNLNSFILNITRNIVVKADLGDLVQSEVKSIFQVEDEDPTSYITSAKSGTLRGDLCLVALHSQDIRVFI